MMPVKTFDYSDERYKTLFANFGLASLKCQVMEKQLSVLVTGISYIGSKEFDINVFRSALDGNRQTMGRMMKSLKVKIAIPDDLEAMLSKALENRNYLIHRFFISRGLELGSISATSKMNAEIIEIGNHFQTTIEKLDQVLQSLQDIAGVPIQNIEEEAKRLFKL